MTFAQNLKKAAKASKLSATALAESSGLSRQSIHLLLQGEREPTLDTAKRLAEALNVTIDWLAGK